MQRNIKYEKLHASRSVWLHEVNSSIDFAPVGIDRVILGRHVQSIRPLLTQTIFETILGPVNKE